MDNQMIDWIAYIKPYLDEGSVKKVDGKFEGELIRDWDTPWLHHKYKEVGCFMGKLFFEIFGLAYSKCQTCYKVVVKPRTLEELHNLVQIQKKLDIKSKCGIEERPYIFGNYGGYFYNNSLEEGQQCYRLVRSEVNKDIPVFLKKGCTEFEQRLGDSKNWQLTEQQIKLEKEFNEKIRTHKNYQEVQDPDVRVHVKNKWIQFAYDRGDSTYKLFTEGKSLYPEYSTYEKEGENAKIFSTGN